MSQIFKNKRFIFALTFFILINISLIANVNALTDDYGNEIKCVLENTGLEDIANRDFCLTFNTQIKDIKYATLEQTAYNSNYINYYLTDFKKVIIDISEFNLGYRYMIFIISKYNYGKNWTQIYGDLKIISNANNLLQYQLFYKDNNGNGNQVGEDIQPDKEYIYANYLPSISDSNTFLIDNNGQWIRYTEQIKNSINDYTKLLFKVNKNKILYTDFNVYDLNGNIIQEPTEVKKDIEEQIEIEKGEIGKNIKFHYNNLKENYLIDIKRKDVETKKNLEWKTNPIRPNITFSTIEFENLTDSYIFERTVYDENKNIIFQKEEIISFGGLFDDLNEDSGVSDYFGFIKIFLKKAGAIISPIFEIFAYFFNNIDPFFQLGIFSSFVILIVYFVLRGVRKWQILKIFMMESLNL